MLVAPGSRSVAMALLFLSTWTIGGRDAADARAQADEVDPTAIVRLNSRVASATFSPDGRFILTVSDGVVRLWNADGSLSTRLLDRPALPQIHGRRDTTIYASSAVFSVDGTRVAVGFADGRIVVGPPRPWHPGLLSLVELRVPAAPDAGRRVVSLALSPGGSQLIATAGLSAYLWLEPRGVPIELPTDYGSIARNASFSPAGDRVLFVSGGVVRVYRVWGGLDDPVEHRHDCTIREAVFSPDGRRILTSCLEARGAAGSGVTIWPVDGQRSPLLLEQQWSGGFSPDGNVIATTSATERGYARLWPDRGHGEPTLFGSSRDAGWTVAFSPDGRKLAIGGRTSAEVWDVPGLTLTRLPHDSLVDSLSFSSDSHRLLTISNGTARVWDVD